jgi:hypothetical protein
MKITILILATLALIGCAKKSLSSASDAPLEIAKLITQAETRDSIYTSVLNGFLQQFEPAITEGIRRPITDAEKTKLRMFFRPRLEALITESHIHLAVAEAVRTNFSQKEMSDILQFYNSPAGQKLLDLNRTFGAKVVNSGYNLGKSLANKQWFDKVMIEMKVEFPQFF